MSLARLPLIFLAAMLVQWWWMTHFTLFGLAPQVLLVLTVALAARQGALAAMFCGFSWGLFLDIMSPRLFGANALALTLIAYGTGSVRRQIDMAGLAPQSLVVVSMTWAYFLLLGFLGLVFDPAKTFFWVGWPAFLIDPFYNCALTAAVFAAWLPPRWEHHRGMA
ncbi:MAG: rod shape-determining protein MreD [Elusimicrobia bacterium]|nr:rod shape-determining protein MreD [Elusimicrobiota bacterium]